MIWYYVDAAGQQAGPVDDAGLDAMLASGKLTTETLVWKDGMTNWLPLREARPAAAVGAAAAPAGGGLRISSGVEEAVCAECGGIFPVSETIRIGSARVCANCKPVFVQKMQEGVNISTPGSYRYAGFWIRWLAAFVDGLILGSFNLALNLAFLGTAGVFGSSMNPGTAANSFVAMRVVLWLVEVTIGLCYATFFIGKYGATLGKMACKIHVIVADGSKVSYPRDLGRHFSKAVSSMTCMIGYIMAGFDDEKRALHDRMCNTRVIYK